MDKDEIFLKIDKKVFGELKKKMDNSVDEKFSISLSLQVSKNIWEKLGIKINNIFNNIKGIC